MAIVRLKASSFPSEENDGLRSPTIGPFGAVNRVLSPVSIDNRKSESGPSFSALSDTTSRLPSGVHASARVP